MDKKSYWYVTQIVQSKRTIKVEALTRMQAKQIAVEKFADGKGIVDVDTKITAESSIYPPTEKES